MMIYISLSLFKICSEFSLILDIAQEMYSQEK